MKKKQFLTMQLIVSLTGLVISIAFMVIFHTEEYRNSGMFGAGLGGFASSLFLLYKAIKSIRNPNYREKQMIKEYDERRVMLERNAATMTLEIMCLILMLAAAACYYVHQPFAGFICMLMLIIQIAIFGLGYFILHVLH